MTAEPSTTYDPRTFEPPIFHDALPGFRSGSDSPRDYIERCFATIAEREPVVQAFTVINEVEARAAADASGERWKAGRPRSPIDGLPIGIKDLLETKDMPTQMGCEAYRGHFPRRDNAAVWALREAGAVILGKTVTAELGGSHPGRPRIRLTPRAPLAARRPARPRRSAQGWCQPRSAPRSAARSSGPPASARTSR